MSQSISKENRIAVSGVIITRNEEKYIARCLDSLGWVDEIIVVDGGSTDRTPEICKDPNAPWAGRIKWIVNPWPGFRLQRNYALAQAKNSWVLVMDSDEECSVELANKISALITSSEGPKYQAYKVRRIEYFLGKQIHYGIWNPSYQDRFFKKEGVEYINDIHEYPRFSSDPSRIHEPIYHSPDFAPEKFLYKMNKYTTIEAADRIRLGQRTNAFRILFAFPHMFLKNYFHYDSYKDGYHGFIISILEGISRAVRHIKMWQIQRDLRLGLNTSGVVDRARGEL